MKGPFAKSISILTALCTCILAIFFFLILPTVRDVNAIQNDLSIEQERLESRYRQGLLLKRLRDDWEKVRPDVALVVSAILHYEASIPFITRLESLANENNVRHRLTLPTIEKKEGAEKVKELSVPFALEWDGAWNSLMHMLVAIEREPYYLPIETIRATNNHTNTSSSFSRNVPSLPIQKEAEEQKITMTLTGTTTWNNESR
ncbi:MAG: hypothetical protein Q7S16_00210 [bacterium]|nr:hypothetical protein [bacterium]